MPVNWYLFKLTDIFYALDDDVVSVIALLHSSSAVDTADHNILLTRLRVCYDVGGAALDWFQACLTNSVECVRRGSDRSTSTIVLFGVRQASVLGQ